MSQLPYQGESPTTHHPGTGSCLDQGRYHVCTRLQFLSILKNKHYYCPPAVYFIYVPVYVKQAMASYPQELAQDAVCQSHTGHMTGLWFLPARPLRLNTNEWMNMSNRLCWLLASRIRMELQFHPDPAHKLSTNLYDIHHCWVYSEKLLMMDRGTVRNM